MLYFKHSELVHTYHVSLKTVHNWIDAAKQGKINLKLHEQRGRTYVANTPENLTVLKTLSEQGKKYRNTRHHKVVTPKPEFYEYYTSRQILDIISNLKIHREIPIQYNYIDGGATTWGELVDRWEEEEGTNLLKGTLELLTANTGALDSLLEGYKRVNVVDVGLGNARPAKDLLNYLLGRGLLHKYMGIDISKTMLELAEQNVKKWFGDKVTFEGYVRDFSFEQFDDLFLDERLGKNADKTANIVLLLGATPMNCRSPQDVLKVIYNSLDEDDLLVYVDKPDSEAERRYFNFNPETGPSTVPPLMRRVIDILNIDESFYDTEMGYNDRSHIRYVRIRLKTALTIKFKFKDSERHVGLEKGEAIVLWRVRHMKAPEIISEFEKTGFTLLHSSLTKNRQFLMTISGIDPKAEAEV